jgi:hypothetical protein
MTGIYHNPQPHALQPCSNKLHHFQQILSRQNKKNQVGAGQNSFKNKETLYQWDKFILNDNGMGHLFK